MNIKRNENNLISYAWYFYHWRDLDVENLEWNVCNQNKTIREHGITQIHFQILNMQIFWMEESFISRFNYRDEANLLQNEMDREMLALSKTNIVQEDPMLEI